ncbi:MAG: hypothetical protein ACJ76H_16305 [Bacteriovoracaceae bacterium]
MKKLLRYFAVIVGVVILSGGYLVFDRWRKNPEQIVPFPYDFQNAAPAIKLDAPILIVGDRMGEYFGRFKAELAASISKNLDNVIKIQSIAADGLGIHRTLHQLKSLEQWPQILIYQGGSEEFFESKFEISEIRKISKNFRLYQDDRLQTFMLLYPWSSRLVYEPMKRMHLPDTPVLKPELSEQEYLQRLETELLLFEEHLNQLVAMAKDRNSLLILTTTPVNLDVAPKTICSFSSNSTIEQAVDELEALVKKQDWKSAYKKATKFTIQYPGNARLYYLQGLVEKNMGKIPEAINSMLQATSYECSAWRATEVQNSIIRKVAKKNQVLLFDFSRMVQEQWTRNVTFFDDIHPQNIYYDKGMNQLGLVIRKILKL